MKPSTNAKTLIPFVGPYSRAYGMLEKADRAALRETLSVKYGIPEPTFYRHMRADHIHKLPKTAMVAVLNTYLKDIGYEYQDETTV